MTRYLLNGARTLRPIILRLIACGIMLAIPALAVAQQSARPSNSTEEFDESNPQTACRLAARIVETGEPPRLVAIANGYIVSCNDQAPAALAAGLRRLRTSTDTTALKAMLRGALFVRDTGFFAVANELAMDPAASPEARAAGFLIAAIELNELIDFGYGEIVANPSQLMCPLIGSGSSLRSSAGVGLPGGAAARVRAAAAGALASGSTPAIVATAARCADIVAKGVLERELISTQGYAPEG
jgi:hypothetical protein